MINFWDFNAWGSFNLFSVLLASLLVASIIKKCVPVLKRSLIPNSVLGGGVLIVVAGIYKTITGDIMFDTPFFGGNGTANLELLTYHCLALGFIAATFKSGSGKLTRKRTEEIFNTGVTTVATYLLQAVLGMGISMLAVLFVKEFFPAAGILLPFGYGQGTGQALNYGTIYENDFGFEAGKSFGLTIAALGFLSASIGGVIHLTWLKRKGFVTGHADTAGQTSSEQIEQEGEIPMQESVDKMTVQISLIGVAYLLAYLLMMGLGALLPGMRSVIFGFNFLLGVLGATLVKTVLNTLRAKPSV